MLYTTLEILLRGNSVIKLNITSFYSAKGRGRDNNSLYSLYLATANFLYRKQLLQ